MTDLEKLAHYLKQYWGYDTFRPNQRDIMYSMVAGEDSLAVLPTGGGKSLCYQIPALVKEGTCLVVSPLIALMRDQIDQLKRRGIPAAGLFSGQVRQESETILENLVNNVYKLLYISPERLQSKGFQEYLRNARISFMAVDEAHCISQWGYDFRPSYLKLNLIRDIFPDLPIMALTASATPHVQKDIQDKLGLRSKNIFMASFVRPNLSFSVFEREDKGGKILEILRAVPGSSVVYVQTRKSASNWASWLIRNGENADYYHAGLSHRDRERKQKNWIEGKTRTLVSTNAFGMGIDKGDVRTVIHAEVSLQPEAYYQEAGRAGRDGKRAFAVAIFTHQEIKDARFRIEKNFPTPERIRDVYSKLGLYLKLAIGSGAMVSINFDIEQFCTSFSLNPASTFQCLKKLETHGYILLNEGFYQPSRFRFSVGSAQLYDAQVRNPNVEVISKALLRLYGGELFSDYLDIQEGEIAKVAQTTPEAVILRLQELQTGLIGEYLPQNANPQITFLIPRLEPKNLDLDVALLRQLKKMELERLETMSQYLDMEKGCRSAFLANYFGEHQALDCGICDHCLEARKKEKPPGFEYYKPLILSQLQEPSNPKKLEEFFKPQQKDDVKKAIRFLLEEEVLVLQSDGTLIRKSDLKKSGFQL
jgi:ATP-dependent DNA helicase RecQ